MCAFCMHIQNDCLSQLSSRFFKFFINLHEFQTWLLSICKPLKCQHVSSHSVPTEQMQKVLNIFLRSIWVKCNKETPECILPYPIIVCLPLECLWSIAINEVLNNVKTIYSKSGICKLQPAACFCLALEVRIVFTFLKPYYKKEN